VSAPTSLIAFDIAGQMVVVALKYFSLVARNHVLVQTFPMVPEQLWVKVLSWIVW